MEKQAPIRGTGFFTFMLKHAKNSQDINTLLNESERRFGAPSWQLLSSAAYTSASKKIDDLSLSVSLLNKIPSRDLNHIHPPVFYRIFNCALSRRSLEVARHVYEMTPNEKQDLRSLSQLVLACDSKDGKFLIQRALLTPASFDLNLLVLRGFLKFCSRYHDIELANQVWNWSMLPRKKTTNKEHLCNVTIQYLILCGKAGDIPLCKSVWNEAMGLGISDQVPVIGAMLNVYGFLGASDETESFLSHIPLKDIDQQMLSSALAAFSHSGRPDKAWNLLLKVKEVDTDKKVIGIQSYNTVIDAYARTGDFSTAMKIANDLQKQGIQPSVVTWISILSPCRHYKNLPIALESFDHLLNSSPSNEVLASAYVLLADVYKSLGDEISFNALHTERKQQGFIKEKGAVNVIVDHRNYTFNVGTVPEELESYSSQIYAKLDEWERFISVKGSTVESIKCQHSEKLALAFAVIRGQKDIVLKKNLRICSACHSASLEITIYESITIRLWDARRVHIMENGQCSCQGKY